MTSRVIGQREAVTEDSPVIRRSNLVRVLPGEAPEDNIEDRDERVIAVAPRLPVAQAVPDREANMPGWKDRRRWQIGFDHHTVIDQRRIGVSSMFILLRWERVDLQKGKPTARPVPPLGRSVVAQPLASWGLVR
jgi:hypothetical protein